MQQGTTRACHLAMTVQGGQIYITSNRNSWNGHIDQNAIEVLLIQMFMFSALVCLVTSRNACTLPSPGLLSASIPALAYDWPLLVVFVFPCTCRPSSPLPTCFKHPHPLAPSPSSTHTLKHPCISHPLHELFLFVPATVWLASLQLSNMQWP